MKLNPSDIARLKPQPKPFKMSDGGGLYLLVAPSGGKLWRYDYNFNGKRKTLSLGASADRQPRRGAGKAWTRPRIRWRRARPRRRKAGRQAYRQFRARTTFAHVAEEVLVRLGTKARPHDHPEADLAAPDAGERPPASTYRRYHRPRGSGRSSAGQKAGSSGIGAAPSCGHRAGLPACRRD